MIPIVVPSEYEWPVVTNMFRIILFVVLATVCVLVVIYCWTSGGRHSSDV